MATLSATAPAAPPTDTTDNTPTNPLNDRLTFPPFPQPPPGVTITPFKDFKEHGIQMFPTENDDVERDGLGIPTVALSKKHDTDKCKTETTRKRKVENIIASKAPGVRKEWWELWMENEDLKRTGPYDPHVVPLDRLYEAAADFRKTRSWPQGPTGIATLWDQFRLFVGLLSNTPVWTRTDKKQESDSDDDDDDASDDGEFENKQPVVDAYTQRNNDGRRPPPPHPRVRARPPYALYGVEPTPVGSDQEVKDLLNAENARREEELNEFLFNPEFRIKVFLSSYIRKQGLIWSDKNLTNIPRLVGFFIRFLIRNRVFPESEYDREFKRCISIIDLAEKELILTSKIAKQIPDDFHKACFEHFGRKSEGYKPVALDSEADAPYFGHKAPEEVGKKDDTSTSGNAPSPSEPVEPDAKRAKLDDANANESGDSSNDSARTAVDNFEAELKAANVQVIKVDDDSMMKEAEQLQIIQDNLSPDIDAVPAWAKSEGWGLPTENEDNDPWAVPAVVDWEPAVKPSFFPFLGPTAFPRTHTSGIVECSVRRIKSFTEPPALNTISKSAVTSEPDADAVEVELQKRFAKVVLSPWAGWDDYSDEAPHMAKPRILETSVGPINGVVGEDGKVEPFPTTGQPAAGTSEPTETSAPALAEGPKPHDPFSDEITLLVEPALLPLLSTGMGLGATWVQIARQQDFGGDEKTKKKKKGKKVSTMRYWYIDELVLTLPSFHT